MSAGSKQSNGIRESGGTMSASNNWGVLPADLHEWAVYQDELGQTRRIFEDITKKEPLPGKALRQLDHAFDLSIYNPQAPKTPRQQEMLNAKRTALFDALANADFNRHLESTGQRDNAPEFDYNGNKFPKSIGPKLFGAEQQSWIENNRPMHDGERAQAAKKLQADVMKATPLDELAPKTPPVEIAQNVPENTAFNFIETAKDRYNPKKPEKEKWVSPHNGRTYIKDTGEMTSRKLIWDWFFEQGDDARSFGPEHPITKDLMKDEGIKQVKEEWLAQGKPKSAIKYHFHKPEYIRELTTLDETGSVLGSYHVYLSEEKDGKIRYDVYNSTDWTSATRIPEELGGSKRAPSVWDVVTQKKKFDGKFESVFNRADRKEKGPGGTFLQHYYWYE